MSNVGKKLRRIVIAKPKLTLFFWVLVVIVALPLAPRLLNNLEVNPDPPPNTDSAKALEIIQKEFPESQNSNHVLIIQMKDGSSVLNSGVYDFTMTLTAKLLVNENLQPYISAESVVGYYIINGTMLDTMYPEFKDQFVSTDGKITYILIDTADEGDPVLARKLFNEIYTIVEDLPYAELNIIFTGFAAIDKEGEESIMHDMERIELFAFPLVIITLAVLLRNPRLVFIPLLAIAMTLIISFAITGVLAENVTILNLVPNVMLSLGLGIGVDYSLFLLSRFKEERQRQVPVPESVDVMLTHAGHTIMVSGLTLAIAFLGLIIFPISVFSSVGIAITITVLVALAINLTFVPAFLCLIGHRLTPYKVTSEESRPQNRSQSYWRTIAYFSSKNALAVIVIIALIALPISYQVLNMKTSVDSFEMIAEDAESRNGFLILRNEFAPGIISPVSIVIQTPSSDNVWSEYFFNTAHNLIEKLVETRQVSATGVWSHTWLMNHPIPYSLASTAMNLAQLNETERMTALASFPAELHSTLLLYPSLALGFVGENLQTALIQVTLSLDPFSEEGRKWIEGVRNEIIPAVDELERYQIYIGGLTAMTIDISQVTYDYFPTMIMVVLIIIGLLVGLMYKSVLVPIRLLATILLTISFIYGLADLFFTEHWGEFFRESISTLNGLFFMIPVMTFSILIGLGMDYDLFILGRIREGVWKGKTTREAIADSLEHTGNVVTGAALIMAIAFGGLMLSSSLALVELGFILAIAVVIDASIVRTFLVPAIMSLAENTNWWPAKVPSAPV